MSSVVYLYGFVPADAPAAPESLTGMADAAVETIDLGPVLAVVSHLPGEMFRADVVEERLQDLAWVGERGLEHERVVLWFVDHADILPTQLFSVHGSTDALRAGVSGRVEQVAHALRELAGRREWNLKVAYDAAELGRHGAEVSDEVRRLDDEMAAAPPGRRYLMERKRAETVKREVGLAARRLAGELLDALRPAAVAVRVLPLAQVDQQGTVVLNAALLVPRENEAALRAQAERQFEQVQRLGIIVSFSGPWAAYRFLEDRADG